MQWRIRRTPQGVRGLKLPLGVRQEFARESHPARGAWIEINLEIVDFIRTASRTPQGVRGLKSSPRLACQLAGRRTPQGVRGLKWRPRLTWAQW